MRRWGPIRKVVVRDGHFGPKEVGAAPEFLSWLTDPAQNGGGALVDFGCYGANLMTWLMRGAAPLTVTAVTQQLKRDAVYARVDDEATIILTYPDAQAIIQGSWNWPDHRKDLEIFGTHGYVFTPDSKNVRMRVRGEQMEQTIASRQLPAKYADGFAYLAAVVRGTEQSGKYRSFFACKQSHCGSHPRCGASLRSDRADDQAGVSCPVAIPKQSEIK